jgi:hypothetical protein
VSALPTTAGAAGVADSGPAPGTVTGVSDQSPAPGGLDPVTVAAVDALPAVSRLTLVAVAGPSRALNAETASWLAARFDVPDPARTFHPSGDQWKVADLDAVLATAALRPEVRNVIVLTDLDRCPPRTLDHVLKVTEEPPAPTTFVVTCAAVDELPVTVQGRVSATVDVVPAASGTADPFTDLFAPEVWMGARIAARDRSEAVVDAARVLLAGPGDGTATSAAAFVDASARLARAAASPADRPAWERDLVRLAVVRRRRVVADAVRAGGLAAGPAARALTDLDRAAVLVDRYVPVASVAAAVAAADRVLGTAADR